MSVSRVPGTLYGALLLLLPPSFRRDYHQLMLDGFHELVRDRHAGRRGTLELWWLLGFDFLATFGREWGTELGMTVLRDLCLRVLGLAAIAGAVGWFVLLIGPEWEPVGDLGWGENGLGYRPRALVLASALLGLGIMGGIWHEARDWSRLRVAGMWLLVSSVVLIAAQAPIPMGGVSFTATPAVGVGVYLLPFALATLLFDWCRPSEARPAALTFLRRVVAVAVSVLAVGLVLPISTHWYDMWDVVLRLAFVFPVLWIALSFGYRLVGGPAVEVRLTRPARAEAA